MSKACFSSSCVIGELEENTLYYFSMQDLAARDRAATLTIAVKTLNWSGELISQIDQMQL
jgi:hypothetical protein